MEAASVERKTMVEKVTGRAMMACVIVCSVRTGFGEKSRFDGCMLVGKRLDFQGVDVGSE